MTIQHNKIYKHPSECALDYLFYTEEAAEKEAC